MLGVFGELFCASIKPVAGAKSPAISVNASEKGNNACFIDVIPLSQKDDEIRVGGCFASKRFKRLHCHDTEARLICVLRRYLVEERGHLSSLFSQRCFSPISPRVKIQCPRSVAKAQSLGRKPQEDNVNRVLSPRSGRQRQQKTMADKIDPRASANLIDCRPLCGLVESYLFVDLRFRCAPPRPYAVSPLSRASYTQASTG